MEIEYKIKKEDYVKFFRIYIMNQFQKKIVFVISLSLIVGYIATTEPFLWKPFITYTLISLVLFIILLYFAPYVFAILRLNKTIKKEVHFYKKKKVITSEEGLIIESEDKKIIWNWTSIASFHAFNNYFYLRLVDDRFFLIPKKLFPSYAETINFQGIIQKQLSIETNTSSVKNLGSLQIKKPPYLLAIICLIPFLGILVGIGIIIYGIIKFKNKIFVFIGVLGLIISLVLSFLVLSEFQDIRNEFDEMEHDFVPIVSQTQLNSLVKEIEFYKVQYGDYPSNLDQIKKNNSMVIIDDPFLTWKDSIVNTKYKYQKVDNKYYLFSSGKDGIPNTKDDLYPRIKFSNENKIGLIIIEKK